MRKVNIISSIIGLLLCAYIWISSAAFPTDAVMKIGPDFFPRLMATGLAVASIALLIHTFWTNVTGAAEMISFKDPGIQRALICFVAAIIYVLLMTVLGFIPSTIIFMMFMMYKLQFRAWLKMFLVSLGTALAVQFAFQGMLDIQLPMGLLEMFL